MDVGKGREQERKLEGSPSGGQLQTVIPAKRLKALPGMGFKLNFSALVKCAG